MQRLSYALVFACGLISLSTNAQDLGGDMSLNKLLVPGSGWAVVVDGLAFADGPCSDAEGNFYYSDMRPGGEGPGLFRIGATDGVRRKLSDAAASGLMFGPDGRLYACQSGEQRVVAFDLKSGLMEVLAEDVKPNDLVVNSKGHLYFTETRDHQVTFLNPETKERRAVDTGITAPNGIALSADGGTLAVSDARGMHVWVFRVEADGSLKFKEPFMTFRTAVDNTKKHPDGRSPVYKGFCRGDGMTSDMEGRWYVATELGVQFFDPAGRISGVLPNPGAKGMTSVCLAGTKRDWLYATCGDTIYRRQVKAEGALYFLNRSGR
ncbi:MAG: SMP-30/gluconolactonase/LRE family protein [Verrucomicrobiae bacterium]|nr:SMP-30/gluconolactonase/LRE family protein [Verrucomicrobiae bacterium]